MTNPTEAIAAAIRVHVWDENQCRCSCGERDEPNTRQWDYTDQQWATHASAAVVAALSAEGFEIVHPLDEYRGQ